MADLEYRYAEGFFDLHLKERLETIGFDPSLSDQSLFTSDKVIYLIYVDNTLLDAEDMQDINNCIITVHKAAEMGLEVEDNTTLEFGIWVCDDASGQTISE
jgi:hemerythrin superfamily protein